jgi:hypothetical protein
MVAHGCHGVIKIVAVVTLGFSFLVPLGRAHLSMFPFCYQSAVGSIGVSATAFQMQSRFIGIAARVKAQLIKLCREDVVMLPGPVQDPIM